LNLFDLSLQLNGFPIKKAKQVLKSIQEQSESDFEHYIENAKQKKHATNLTQKFTTICELFLFFFNTHCTKMEIGEIKIT